MLFKRSRASYIIDTSQLLTRELKADIEKIFVQNQDYKNLFVTIYSFGFKSGIPADSDLVFDVRFLPNHITWKGFVPRQEMTRKFRIMCFNLRRRTSFWIN